MVEVGLRRRYAGRTCTSVVVLRLIMLCWYTKRSKDRIREESAMMTSKTRQVQMTKRS